MEINDFIKYFDDVNIVKINQNYKYSYIEITELITGYAFIQFKINKSIKNELTFAVTQRSFKTE